MFFFSVTASSVLTNQIYIKGTIKYSQIINGPVYPFYKVNLLNLMSKNSIRDARTPHPREIFSTPRDTEVLYQYKLQDTFRALSVI